MVTRLLRQVPYVFGPSLVSGLALALMGGLTLAWCVASLWFPFGWDQGIMASVGDAIVRGGMPYQNGWDMKGPIAFYGFAAAQWIFGQHMWAIRVLDVLLLFAACTALFRMMGRLTTPRVAIWTSVGLALSYASLSWFHVSQPDGWVALLMLLGVGPLVARSKGPSAVQLSWCALVIGICALVKPFYAAFILVPGVVALVADQPVSRRARAVAIVSVSAMIPPLLCAVWFARQGALGHLIEVHLNYSRLTYAGIQDIYWGRIITGIVEYLWTGGPRTPGGNVAVLLPAIGFGLYALWRESRQLGITLAMWLGVALFCVALQGKFFVYHWAPAFPPFAVLGAFGLWKLFSFGEDRASPGRVFSLIAAVVCLAQLAVTPAAEVGRWLELVSGTRTSEEYHAEHVRWGHRTNHVIEAADHIRDQTDDTDEVAVWGLESMINFLSGRTNPTRFVMAYPLFRDSPLRANYRQEYMDGLSEHPPVYIVVGFVSPGATQGKALNEFPELVELLRVHYRLETQIGALDLYRLLE